MQIFSVLHQLILFLTVLVPFLDAVSGARISQVADEEAAVKSFPNSAKTPPGLKIENLQLEPQNRRRTTQSPALAVGTTSTTPHPPLVDESDAVLYRLDNSENRACILILTDAILQFDYRTKLNEAREEDLFVPPRYEAEGNCDSGDDVKFTIKWKNYAWTIFFSKTPGGDHWYVDKMSLDANMNDKHLEHVNRPPGTMLHFVSNDQGGMLFPTPVGKSYACNDEVKVLLTDNDIKATVLLRKLKMQPFIFKNDFGPEHTCSPGGGKSYRDETAPVAVGSTLAVVSILTVAGYGVYRYMKVKKVQYDTME